MKPRESLDTAPPLPPLELVGVRIGLSFVGVDNVGGGGGLLGVVRGVRGLSYLGVAGCLGRGVEGATAGRPSLARGMSSIPLGSTGGRL